MKSTPIFQKNWESTKRIVINRGGTRSGKTYSMCQILAIWLINGKIRESDEMVDEGVIHVVRKNKSTIEATVMRDFEEVLHDNELYGLVEHNKTLRQYKFETTKGKYRMVEFIGADDQQKLRGSKRLHLYCNEANELNYKQEFFQLLMRTSGLIFLDFNPDDEEVWINTELEQKRAKDEQDVEVIVSTYKDNPFLPDIMVNEIELLEKTDPMYWKIYGQGEYGKIQGLVYENYFTALASPLKGKFLGYGLDFGYSNDPTAIVSLTKEDDDIYVEELLFEKGLTNDDIATKLKLLGVDKSDPIYCDSAEPKSIQELCNHGFNAKPAKKGRDSINYGINLIKQFNFNVIEPSYNLIKELKHYKWIEDKDGKTLNKPVDAYNHCFVGHTKILTTKGQINIEDIEEGDEVITSQGPRRVIKHWDNGEKQVFRYSLQFDTFSVVLECTPNHKVWTNKGWTKVSELKSGMTVCLSKRLAIELLDYIHANVTSREDVHECILKCGKMLTARFRKVFTSTTEMETPGIIVSRILSLLKNPSTFLSICKKGLKKILSSLRSSRRKGLQKHPSGTEVKRGELGTKSTEGEPGKDENTEPLDAITAEKNTKRDTLDYQNTVMLTAKLVRCVQGEDRKEKVYDLTVEGEHEYFANNILVHNCLDATRYVCMETLKAKRSPLSLSEKKRQISNFKATLINSGVKV